MMQISFSFTKICFLFYFQLSNPNCLQTKNFKCEQIKKEQSFLQPTQILYSRIYYKYRVLLIKSKTKQFVSDMHKVTRDTHMSNIQHAK